MCSKYDAEMQWIPNQIAKYNSFRSEKVHATFGARDFSRDIYDHHP